MLENIFHLKENHTDVKTEIMAGITTFMTMAYILAVNPNILSASGMDSEAVLIATALASFVGTALMALLANYPFALAPGMGLNAYFSYTVVLTMGYSWQLALMAVFVEGIIFIVLSLTNVREGIFNAIPMTLKSAVSVGIGLFVAFVGLQNAKLIVNSDSTLVTYQHFKGETFHSVGVGAILALIGIVITAILAALASGAATWASATWVMRERQPPSLHSVVHEKLDLSPEQDRRLDVVEARFAALRPALEAEVRAANRELAAAIAASDGDTPQVQAAVDHFHAAMGDLQKATITHVFEMRSVLTPAQAEVFDAAVVEALHDDAG